MMAVADGSMHTMQIQKELLLELLSNGCIRSYSSCSCIILFVGGQAIGGYLTKSIPEWFMSGLGAAGGAMRFVGFAILLKVMVSKELWGFYFRFCFSKHCFCKLS